MTIHRRHRTTALPALALALAGVAAAPRRRPRAPL